ncbi:MAG: biliverdin-producing heme oxygenase [Myxococcota bacterium]
MNALATPISRSEGLSKELREGTVEAHRTAERASYVRAFLRGILDPASYLALLERLLPVYRNLEAALRAHRDHPAIGSLYRGELLRQSALEQDIRYFGGDPASSRPLSAATQCYVDRIRGVAQDRPELLIAHAYTRYLGDLSGGRVMGKMMRKSLNLCEGEGDTFYRFPEVSDAKAYKLAYKVMLDSLPVRSVRTDEIVTEARHAFALNRALFDELEGNALRALVQTMAPTLSRWVFRYGVRSL